MTNMDSFTCRRALEALRNGVPNKQAVELLGSNQTGAQGHFSELLSRVDDKSNPPAGTLSMLVSGDFGTGKSHLLAYLEHEALERGFVCSRVTISKETPLFNLDKVYKSAIDYAQIPNATGRLMEEIGLKLNDRSSRAYDAFSRWANSSDTELHLIFPATLLIHERLNDFDFNNEIEAFWSGGPIRISRIREGLRTISQQHSYNFKAPTARELPPQRLRFATEMIKGAGYNGWVVLLDEIELVGSYSLLQRARSYAELTRWLGKAEASSSRYRTAGTTGMKILQRDTIPLAEPTEEDLRDTIEKLRQIYSAAYAWDAPPLPSIIGGIVGEERTMRCKVALAISRLRFGSRAT